MTSEVRNNKLRFECKVTSDRIVILIVVCKTCKYIVLSWVCMEGFIPFDSYMHLETLSDRGKTKSLSV